MIRAIRSLRILRKHWKLTAIAVFSLSVAMALGVLALSISNTFLFLSLAAPNPDRLVMIHARAADKDVDQISYPDWQYIREHNQVFTDVAAAPNSIGLQFDKNEKREIRVVNRPVSENYFAVLGIRPFLGRLFAPGDDRSGAKIAVMTYTCWKRLGSDANIIGTVIAGNTIIGVTPREFTGSFYGVNGDLLLPLDNSLRPGDREKRDARGLFLLARLKPGVTKTQAQAEVAQLAGQLASAYPAEDKGRTAVVARASLLPPDGVQTAEWVAAIFMAVVLLVLLIACANVANLLLAVAVGRRQEATIKLALGASRGRIVREFLKESAIICGLSGAIGYSLAAALIARYSDVTITVPVYGAYSFSPNLHLDWTVAALTLGLMFLALLATGLAPALYASSPHLAQVLSGEIAVGGTRKNARRNALVIVQVAMCTLVLVGMGLCQRDLYNLRQVDPGFSARNLIAVPVIVSEEKVSEERGRELYREVHRKVSELPGVEAASLSSDIPLLGGSGEPVQSPDGKKTAVSHFVVDNDYFATLGIRVLSGRVFQNSDVPGGPEAIVINHKMAEMFWPGQEPLGKIVMVGEPARKTTVVGIVADGKYEDLDEAPHPFYYSAVSQHYAGYLNIIARTKGDPRRWSQPLAEAVRSTGAFVLTPFTFDSWMNLTMIGERITGALTAGLSALGLLLAIIGLFGAISYSVSERKKELGIRVALGASRAHLFRMVLRQTLVIGGAGVAIGILMGVGVTMLLQSQFYQVHAVEWTVLVPVAAGMLGISLLVAYLSARPWVSVNPMEAVRHA
ncbi:MAG TPA: ADOP family duplicated permease [Bryobacteraceae bacterium]|jgi:putative ABC transport system permease protein